MSPVSSSTIGEIPDRFTHKSHFIYKILTTRSQIPLRLGVMKKILIVAFSAGWLLPLWVSATALFQFMSTEVWPRMAAGGSPLNSFPFLQFSSQAFTLACIWLACVIGFWAWRAFPSKL
jgi:hypothetical protein